MNKPLTLFTLIAISAILFSSFSYRNITAPENEKLSKALEIFNTLKEAKGILPSSPPKLRLVSKLPEKKFALAMARNSTQEIFIEEAAFDLCMDSLGHLAEDGLAYLLAHELAHFTHQHNVRHQFIEKFDRSLTVDTGFTRQTNQLALSKTGLDSLFEAYKKIEESYQIRKNEAEADLEAGFNCYLAGYNAKEAGPIFLDKAYKFFNIDKSGGEYASLDDRKEIIKRSGQSLDSLIHIFETGNYLTIANYVPEAIECYNYVSKRFPSKKIFNNAGVLGLKKASTDIAFEDIGFALPVTLDLLPIAVEGTRTDMTDEQWKELERMEKDIFQSQARFVYQAIDFFDKAISLDSDYHIAELNKSVAHILIYFLKGNFETIGNFDKEDLVFAEAAALKSKQIYTESEKEDSLALSNIFNLLSVIKSHQGDHNQALEYIHKATKIHADNKLVKMNFDILTGNSDADLRSFLFEETDNFKLCEETEIVGDNLSIDKFEEQRTLRWNMNFTVNSKKPKNSFVKNISKVHISEIDGYKLFKYSFNRGSSPKKTICFFAADQNNNGSTICDISKGSSLQDINDEYGNPLSILPIPDGSIAHFKNIMFYLDNNNMVTGWVFYQESHF